MGEEKESLKKKALSAYKAFLEERRRGRKRLEQIFIEKAIKDFKGRFGREPQEATPVSWDECLFVCDGLTFRAKKEGAEILFYVIVECEKCHRPLERLTQSLIALGNALSEPQICLECKWKGN